MLEIKLELAMDIGQVNGIQHAPLFLHFSIYIERSTRNRRVQHELVEIGFAADGVLNLCGNVGRCVVLQANDRGTLHADAVLAQFVRELMSVFAFQLGVVVGVGQGLDGWYGSDMAAQNDGGVR